MKIPLPLTIVSLIILTSVCRAQDTPPATPPSAPSGDQSGGGGQHHHPDFFSQLNLTPDQQSKIAQIKSTVTDKKERHDQIQAVLTDDQKAKLTQLMNDWKASHPHGGNSGSASGALAATPSPAPAQ